MAFGTPYYIGSSTPSASTTQTITVGTATSAGDAIIVSTGCSSTSVTVSGIIDSSSNTYTAAIPAVTSDEFGQVWIAPDSAALTTSDTITVTYVGSGGEKLAVAVGVSGVATSSEVDSAKASAQASTGSPSVTSGTLAHASELAIGVIFNKSTGGAPSGFGSFAETTSQQSGTSPYVTVCYLDTASTTAVTFSATITSTDWSAFIIPLLSGGNTSNLTLAGTVNVAPALARRPGKALTATIATAATLTLRAGKALTVVANVAATLLRGIQRPVAGTVNVQATVPRTATRILAAALPAAAALTRKTGKPLPAVVTAAAAAAFSTGKVLAAAMSTAAALARNTGKTLTVAINAAAAGTITKVRQVVLAAAVTVSGGMGRQAGKLLTAAVNTAASAGRVISRTLSAVADLAVTVAIGGHSVVYQLTLAAASSVTSTVTAAAGRLVVIWSTGMARLKWTAGGARTRWKTITGRWKWPSGPSRG